MRQSRIPLMIIGALAAFTPPAAAQRAILSQQATSPTAPAPAMAPAMAMARTLVAGRVEEAAPVIDGRLDDAIWARAAVATDFVQFMPASGQPSTQRTEARVLVSGDAVYVAMRMYDTDPAGIAAQMGRRDAFDLHSDWAHVVIDSYNDGRTAFRFSVTPKGVQKDVLHHNDTEEDAGWNAIWQSSARIDEEGWTAEFRIPLSQLRFSTRSGTAGSDGAAAANWGINFGREIARNGERAYWAPVLQGTPGFVSRMGELHDLPALASPRRLEVLPYSLGRTTRAPGNPANPFYQPTAFGGEIGADLKYGLTSNLTLTATLNPDFGQVEADPSEVNLTAFESFFGEQRPFFVEGSDIFRFRMAFGDGDNAGEQLFYSRRIGRAPQAGLPGDTRYSDRPDAAAILGAAKLSGKTASGWSLGVLSALTGAEHAAIVDTLGLRRDAAVEPMTSYNVARLSRDFRGGSSNIGAIFTATNRDLDDERLQFLRSAAYTGGVDLRHRFASGNYELAGSVIGSHIRGSEDAITRVQRSAGHYFQRPDADHLTYDPTRTSLSGAAAMVNLMKLNGNWNGAIGSNVRSAGLETNDLGFQRDADNVGQFAWVGYRRFVPGQIFRSLNLNFNQWAAWTLGGERTGTGGNVNGWFQFNNYWSFYGGANQNLSALSTGMLRGGPAIIRPHRTNFWFGLNSDGRKQIGLNLNGWGNTEPETGSGTFSIGPSVRVRPSTQIDLSVGPRMTWTDERAQWVGQRTTGAGTSYLLGHLEQRTAALVGRLSYTVSPTLSLQLYAQPFVSAGAYSGFMEVVDPRARRFDERVDRYGTDRIRTETEANGRTVYRVDRDGNGSTDFSIASPDFNVRQFRSNAVARWEYRPGSTLFLVWSQGRDSFASDGSFDLGRDSRSLVNAPGTNVLLIKASYWLNL